MRKRNEGETPLNPWVSRTIYFQERGTGSRKDGFSEGRVLGRMGSWGDGFLGGCVLVGMRSCLTCV